MPASAVIAFDKALTAKHQHSVKPDRSLQNPGKPARLRDRRAFFLRPTLPKPSRSFWMFSQPSAAARPARAAFLLLPFALALGGPAVAQACPDFTRNGVALGYGADDLWSPKTHEVLAGGGVNLAQCLDMPGIGMVGPGPDFTLTYEAGAGMALSISAHSDCDTVLLVNGPTMAWEFDDDSAGDLNPMLWFDDAESGLYDIWVGTIDDALCGAVLTLETFN
jgi:hypothetical protein